ncbi:MAG TPA: DinB family protein, partial [Thermomicrobiales bacterium]|nr:DinB family protein [Thermomicrobiales bacterium]
WASSLVTFAEDRVPLDRAELDAWLWRIDLVVGMVAERASSLSPAELDWSPPDGSWSLRQTLNHLAAAELYYVRWLDEPLPDNPVARYTTASAMVAAALPTALDAATDPNIAFAHANNADPGHCAPEEIAEQILEQEAALLAT